MTIEEALALAAESQTKGSYVLDKADMALIVLAAEVHRLGERNGKLYGLCRRAIRRLDDAFCEQEARILSMELARLGTPL